MRSLVSRLRLVGHTKLTALAIAVSSCPNFIHTTLRDVLLLNNINLLNSFHTYINKLQTSDYRWSIGVHKEVHYMMFTCEFRIRIRIGEVLFVVLVGLSATSGLTDWDNRITLMAWPFTEVINGSRQQLNCFWLATPTSDSSFVYFQKQDAIDWSTFATFNRNRQNASMQSDVFAWLTGYNNVANLSYEMVFLKWMGLNEFGNYRCKLKSGQTSDPVNLTSVPLITAMLPMFQIGNLLPIDSPSATVESGDTVNFTCGWFAYSSNARLTIYLSRLNSSYSWVSLGSFPVTNMTARSLTGNYSRLIANVDYNNGFLNVSFQMLQSQVSDTGLYRCSLSDGRFSDIISISVVPATSTAAISTVISPESISFSLFEWVMVGAGVLLVIVLVVFLVVCKVRYNFEPCREPGRNVKCRRLYRYRIACRDRQHSVTTTGVYNNSKTELSPIA